jgi:hypothetical protein
VGRLPAAIALRGLGGTKDREERRGVARGVEVFEVQTKVPGLLVVELVELLRPHLELDREYGQLQPPRGELLGGERVAMRARERRVDLVVGGAEERVDRVGIEGGVETRARHGGQPTKARGQPWSRRG